MFKSKIIRIISMVSAVACITTCVNLSSVTNISYADDYNSRVETMVLEEENNIKSYPVEIAGDFMTFIIEGTPGTNVNGCLVGYTYKGEEGEKIEWKGKIRDDGTLKVEIDTYNIYGYKGEFQIWESDDNSAELVNQQIWVTTTADMRSTTTTTTTTSGTTMTTTSGTTMPKTSGTTMTTTSGTKITTTSSTTITTTSGTTMTTTPTITTTSGTTMTTTNTMPAPVGYIAGDANCDNEVNIADATAIVQHLGNKDKYGLSEAGERNADVDGVEGVTGSDALVLQQVEANMISLADLPLKK